MKTNFFDDFTIKLVDTPYGMIRARVGGSGYPILLLHVHRCSGTVFEVERLE